MLFNTPRTREEEKEIKDYMAKHPYTPFIHPSQKDIDEAKSMLKAIKASKSLAE